jgi:putative DNA primase/helicase
MEYERVRKDTAKEFGVRVSFLDQAVDHQRSANVCLPASTPFLPQWAVKPYSRAVDPGKLADEIFVTLSKFVVADPIYLMVVTMWIMLTWLLEKSSVLPRLIITAPDKGCGKTVCLTVVGLLSQRSLQSSSISPASFFRLVEAYQPTLLIDEADTLPKDSDQIRGLLNAGHTKESANVVRTEEVNGQYTPVLFKCFCPVALAGIKLEKKLAGTVLSRGIIIQLRKKLKDEKVQKVRRASKQAMETLKEKLARFAIDFGSKFEKLEPELEELGNRDADNWEPLLAVAELCGPEWYERIKQAAIAITDDTTAESIDIKLLRDIKAVFEARKAAQLATSDLIDGLAKMETAPWKHFSRGMCINARQVADRLESFGVKPVQLGTKGPDGKNRRGYRLSDFADAFERYLDDKTVIAKVENDFSKEKEVIDELEKDDTLKELEF